VRVDQKIGPGKVKITLAFPDWTEGKVAPAKYEIPVEDEEEEEVLE
jgi:hypothetical protein